MSKDEDKPITVKALQIPSEQLCIVTLRNG